ncbi:hypothetical protein [Trichormus variabilis]|uniref:Uncharacterized protein n=1 Tax=Trichormus variabilis SAG 1403-4b TaxID=447716 RepID=A0A3S1BV85_ANAVA|nr:hypothetical protein [Trichormus variabilis]MBD2626955.1 hypothetical protein [Trichormus variabilis FACHB-164]RUS95460.1 hypothetical protein DSM107003_31630 [Trichormus variabilis SAG 1403-4b]
MEYLDELLQFSGNSKMKKLLAGITAFSLCITSPGIVKAQEFTEFKHQNDRYYYETLNSQGVTYYKYKVPAYSFGVFTLKNHSRRADFDIYIYDYSGGWKLLAKGKNTGVTTELVTTPTISQDRYAYIKIVNYGSQPSQYLFYANHVTPGKNFAIALAETIIICSLERKNIDSETSSRLVTGISSILQGNNLAGLNRDLFINDMTGKIRKQLGYGCTADFAVNWVVSMIKDVYRNYP